VEVKATHAMTRTPVMKPLCSMLLFKTILMGFFEEDGTPAQISNEQYWMELTSLGLISHRVTSARLQ